MCLVMTIIFALAMVAAAIVLGVFLAKAGWFTLYVDSWSVEVYMGYLGKRAWIPRGGAHGLLGEMCMDSLRRCRWILQEMCIDYLRKCTWIPEDDVHEFLREMYADS